MNITNRNNKINEKKYTYISIDTNMYIYKYHAYIHI